MLRYTINILCQFRLIILLRLVVLNRIGTRRAYPQTINYALRYFNLFHVEYGTNAQQNARTQQLNSESEHRQSAALYGVLRTSDAPKENQKKGRNEQYAFKYIFADYWRTV